MSFELVVILFVALSVISSLINKVLEARRRRELEEEDLDTRPMGIPDADPTEDDIFKALEARRRRELEEADLDTRPKDVPDADPSEDDILEKPGPNVPRPMGGEFHEVRGTRRVSEAPSGPEFQEVRGTRPVSEPAGGREFREVRGARPVSEVYTGDEYRRAGFDPPEEERPSGEKSGDGAESAAEGELGDLPDSQPQVMAPRRKTRSRRIDLDFKPKTVRKAIIYNEILGPPAADRRP